MKFNTRYNLRRQDSKRAEKIYLVCRFGGERLVYPTNHNILPKHWSTDRGEVKNVIDEPYRDCINSYLYELRQIAKGLYSNAVPLHIPPKQVKEVIKKGLDKWTGKIVEEKLTFWKFIDSYIVTSHKRIDPKTGKIISKKVIQRYEIAIGILHEFEKESGIVLDFDNINLTMLANFRDFLTTVKGYAINYIAKLISILRQFLRAAASQKITFDTDILDTQKFIIAKEDASDIYLNETELAAITTLNLSNNSSLDKARDLFLIGCYTGLRISDYNNIQPHNIKEDLIDLYQYKTGGRVVIPIHQTVKSILTKYNGCTPPKMADQTLNELIKIVCQEAGLKDRVEKQQTKGGAKVSTVLEKWQMVSSHTARRSFATNMVKQGIPIQTIMAITGHKKEVTFLKYVKLSSAEHAEIMRQHWAQDNKQVA